MVSLPDQPARDGLSPADAALLDAFLEHGFSTPALAAATGNPSLKITDVIAWLSQPRITETLNAILRAQRQALTQRLARARFTAIEALDQLAATASDPAERRRAATTLIHPAPRSRPRDRAPAHRHRQDVPPPSSHADRNRDREGAPRPRPISPSQREGAGGWVREPLDNNPRPSQTDPSRNPKPLPEGGVGVGSRDSELQEPGGRATNPGKAISPSQREGAGGWVREPSDNDPRPSQTDLSISSKPLPNASDVDSAPTESQFTTLADLVADFRADLDQDRAEDRDLDGDDTDEFSDAALDRFAQEFEQRLGVPITHPDITAALAEGRINDLDQIAATIRANAPP